MAVFGSTRKVGRDSKCPTESRLPTVWTDTEASYEDVSSVWIVDRDEVGATRA